MRPYLSVPLLSTLLSILLSTLLLAACASSTAGGPEAPSETAASASDRDARVRAVAGRAYEAFAQGWASGDFAAYLAMLAPEMEFSFPAGAHRGHVTGAEGHRRMVAKVRDHSDAGQRLTLEPPIALMIDGDWASVLFESHGTFGDYQYRAHNLIAFRVEEGRITGFREFLGDVDPAFVCGQ